MGFLSALIAPAANAYKAYVKRKAKKDQYADAVHQKQLDNIALGKVNEAEWNKNAQLTAGWRPGFLTIILTIPLVLVFIPSMVPHIEAGFAALETTPLWYRGLVGTMAASAFGLKKVSDYIMAKKYQ